jgi:hypothetical protein
MIKKFDNYLYEGLSDNLYVTFELIIDNKKYYILALAKDTQIQATFTENGEKIENFATDDILNNMNDVNFKPLDYTPEQVINTLKELGVYNNIKLGKASEINPFDEYSDEYEKPINKNKSYSNMGKDELNYQLNIAIDNKDWKTAKEISSYLKESLIDKMTPKTDDNLNEIIKLLEENGYTYRGVNIDDEGEYYKKEREKDVLWYIYGDDDYKKRTPNTHYISITKNSNLSDVKERINLYKKRYNL